MWEMKMGLRQIMGTVILKLSPEKILNWPKHSRTGPTAPPCPHERSSTHEVARPTPNGHDVFHKTAKPRPLQTAALPGPNRLWVRRERSSIDHANRYSIATSMAAGSDGGMFKP